MVSTLTSERGSKLLSGFFDGKEFAYGSLRNPHGCLRQAPYCHLLKGSPLEGFDLCSFGGEEAEGTVMVLNTGSSSKDRRRNKNSQDYNNGNTNTCI